MSPTTSNPANERATNRPPDKPPTIEDLTERLSEAKVNNSQDKSMEGLADAFGEKWAPNSTHAAETKGLQHGAGGIFGGVGK